MDKKHLFLCTATCLFLMGCKGEERLASEDEKANPPVVSSFEPRTPRPPIEQSEPTVSKKKDFLAGTYRFFEKGSKDPQCNADEDNRCANPQEWQELCESSSQVMSRAQRTAISYTKYYEKYDPLVYLLENGGSSEPDIEFVPNHGIKKSCRVSFIISGIFEGTQYREYIEGYAEEIFVMRDGKKIIFALGLVN